MADPYNIPPVGPMAGGLQPGRLEPPSIEPGRLELARPADRLEGPTFREVLADTISEVQELQNEADTTIRRLVAGEIADVTEAMVAVERADVAFQTMMAVRNRIVAAYEEIMRMQV